MTTPEHDESEELYHELRRKLDGYGSDPSEAVWAAIQQQLPPPPAGPPSGPAAGPPRWRPWVAAALVGVSVLLTALWLLWPQLQKNRLTPEAAAPGAAVSAPVTSERAATQSIKNSTGQAAPAAAAATGAAPSNSQPVEAAASSIQPTTTSSAKHPTDQSPAAGAASLPAAAGKPRASRATTSPRVAVAEVPTPRLADTDGGAANRKRPARPYAPAIVAAATPARPRPTPAAEKAASSRSAVPAAASSAPNVSRLDPAPLLRAADTATTGTAATPDSPHAASNLPATAGSASGAGNGAARPLTGPPAAGTVIIAPTRMPKPIAATTRHATTETNLATNARAARLLPGNRKALDRDAAGAKVARHRPATTAAGRSTGRADGALRRRGENQVGRPVSETGLGSNTLPLALRPAVLPTLPEAPPAALQRVAADSLRWPRPPRRWAVQVLAGPSVTHQRLDPNGGPDGVTFAGVERLERPAVAYATQAQVSYALSGRLHVLAGLGYSQHAQQLNFLTRRRSAFDTVTTTQRVRQRDVHHFLTLPLYLRYDLGSRARLRYAAVGGLSPMINVGGRTTVGTPCSCEQQSYAYGDEEGGQFTVGLTAGVEARYQVAPRWTWLLQPTFTYSLSSTVVPGRPRNLWAASLLTGFSFDLRPNRGAR